MRRSTVATPIGRLVQRAKRRLGLAATGAIAIAALLGGPTGCDSGAGDYGVWQQAGSVPQSGRTAISWTINGTPLTTASCQSQHIDSMTIQFVSDQDPQSATEFLEVACNLSRYSVAMVPIGDISIYVNAIHSLRSQDCVRYAGITHGTAGTDFPTSPLPVDLKLVGNCQ